jgi:uroporphyrinogen-III synthase
MRVVVTRPQADAERTTAVLRARGHDVLVAPLMRVEPIAVNLDGKWSAVVITSANAPNAIAHNSARDALIKLPGYAVGRRSAEAAQQAGFTDVASANGDVHDLVRLIAARFEKNKAPVLYLAGEDRATDLLAELSVRGIVAEMRVVYRAVTTPLPSPLIEALKAGEVDAVLHFSRRSADNYVTGARTAGISGPALAVRQLCLSEQVAEPLAGASRISIAVRPDEAALIDLLSARPG